jgi:hypothetical protein
MKVGVYIPAVQEPGKKKAQKRRSANSFSVKPALREGKGVGKEDHSVRYRG